VASTRFTSLGTSPLTGRHAIDVTTWFKEQLLSLDPKVCNCDRVDRRSCPLCHKHCRCTVSPHSPACAKPKLPERSESK
jgi:hypothetical protein